MYLQAAPASSPQELKKRVQAAVPRDVKVQTGEENANEQTSRSSRAPPTSSPTLLAFAGAAVFVGLFIIFNTYSITVAQRIREFAMLRTLGASRRQVLRSVLAEAALMGLVASLIGIGWGILLAVGLNALFKAVGVDLPTAAISIPLVTAVLLPLAVGVGAALIASVAPAIRGDPGAADRGAARGLRAAAGSAGAVRALHRRWPRRRSASADRVCDPSRRGRQPRSC